MFPSFRITNFCSWFLFFICIDLLICQIDSVVILSCHKSYIISDSSYYPNPIVNIKTNLKDLEVADL
jgi:hypothetical protein